LTYEEFLCDFDARYNHSEADGMPTFKEPCASVTYEEFLCAQYNHDSPEEFHARNCIKFVTVIQEMIEVHIQQSRCPDKFDSVYNFYKALMAACSKISRVLYTEEYEDVNLDTTTL
jgi:hypothetical protein